MNSSATDNVHSPNKSSVVSDILRCEELAPPKMTTTLKVCPYPNTTAECHFRGVMATGRVTCENNGRYEYALTILS